MQAMGFRLQSASKCLNAGSREVNCLNALLIVGHCSCFGKGIYGSFQSCGLSGRKKGARITKTGFECALTRLINIHGGGTSWEKLCQNLAPPSRKRLGLI